jgi:membrane protease YdiL (CAAX protease family)
VSATVPPRPDLPGTTLPGTPLAGTTLPGTTLPAMPGDAVPRASWRWWEVILLYLGGQLLAGLLLAFPLANRDIQAADGGSTGLGIAAAMASEILVTLMFVLWLRSRHPYWIATVRFPTKARLPKEVGVGILLGIALYPAVSILGGILTAVFQSLVGRGVQAPEQLSNHLGTVGAILAVVYALAVAPFAEEFFFRGLLFRSLRDRYGFWPGALVSSVAFGLVHYVPAPWQDAVLLQTIMVFTGFGLATIYERRGNLVADWAAHATFNAIGLIAIFTLGASMGR